MIPLSTKETNQKEKDLYYAVLSFLKKIRKAGKTTNAEWKAYKEQLLSIAPSSDMGNAADMWTMDNLDQFSPDKSQLPPVNDMDAVAKVSPKFASQLMEAMYYGMLNLTQANLISDEIQDADPECVSTASLEELLVKLWIGNATFIPQEWVDKIQEAKMLQKDLPAKVRDFFANAEVGSTRRDSVVNNHHVMYKLINKQVSLDSVELGYVIVQGDAKMQQSVLEQLNAGKTPADVMKAYPKKVDAKDKEWQRVFNFPDSSKAKLTASTPGTYFVFNSGEQGAVLMNVTDKKAPKTFYTLATISYDAYASTKTSEQMRDKFQDFLNKNKTAKAFEENAAKAGYNATEMMISPSTAQLGMSMYGQGGIKDTRKAIKWAFDNKKGDVSPIFNDNNDVMVAVAIDEIYEEGYLPYTFKQGKEMLTERVRNSKKGDDLIKQYKGKANDLNGYAAAMGVTVDTVNVVFSSYGDPKLGNEPGIIGRMAVSQVGKLQGPWKGENAVFVYQVVKQERAERKPTKEELDNRYAQSRGAQVLANPRNIYNILSKATKVKKRLIDFY